MEFIQKQPYPWRGCPMLYSHCKDQNTAEFTRKVSAKTCINLIYIFGFADSLREFT